MSELANCTNCGAVFVKTNRDICQKCYREEEKAFQKVYHFLREKKNREATMQEVVTSTGVEEELIIKFMKQKRLLTSQFPKLSYPCEKCGTPIIDGRICGNCSNELLTDLEKHEAIEKLSEKNKKQEQRRVNTYYTFDKHNKNT